MSQMSLETQLTNPSVGACIAHFAANLTSEKVTIVENAQIIQIAKEWREANGQAKH